MAALADAQTAKRTSARAAVDLTPTPKPTASTQMASANPLTAAVEPLSSNVAAAALGAKLTAELTVAREVRRQ